MLERNHCQSSTPGLEALGSEPTRLTDRCSVQRASSEKAPQKNVTEIKRNVPLREAKKKKKSHILLLPLVPFPKLSSSMDTKFAHD